MKNNNKKAAAEKKPVIVEFPGAVQSFDADVYEMDPEQLRAYLAELEKERDRLDAAEPRDLESEEYDQWADEHEELEDLIDDVIDRLEQIQK